MSRELRQTALAVLATGALALAGWGLAGPQGAARPAAHRSPAEAWLLAHVRLAAGPGARPATRMHLTETWTSARGRADPTDRAQVLFLDSVELEVPMTRQGHLLSRRQAEKVSRRLARVRTLVRQAWRGPRDNGRLVIVDNQVLRLGALVARFDWRSLGSGNYRGVPCRRFAFAPRPGVRATSRVEQVMAAMAGAVCVEPTSGLVLEVHYHNQEPVKFGWGLLGDFRGISGSFTAQRAGTVWTWGRTVVHLRGRELWFSKSGTLVKQYRLGSSVLSVAAPKS